MDSTEPTFTVDDPVHVVPGTAGAADLEPLTGKVIGFEQANHLWVVVRFPKHPSGRPDHGWLFRAATLAHAEQAIADAA